jgi:uncharacterized repeat protein (TIGR04138 family)
MQKLDFDQALDLVLSQDPRYGRGAYHFLREALDFTLKQRRKVKDVPSQTVSAHVSGPQLLDGIRLYALKEFGPMVPTVFEDWGVGKCEDFGAMVFNLIAVGVFGKNETDSVDDFKGGYSFKDAFVLPFLPDSPQPHRRALMEEPAKEFN